MPKARVPKSPIARAEITMKKIVLIVALCLIGRYVLFWYEYAKSIDEDKLAWYKEKYVGKKISGVLKRINQYNNNPPKVVLSITNKGEKLDIRYGAICVEKEFVDFVQEGDSVFKTSGEKLMRFCKTNGNCRNFELNFCDKFK